MKESDKINRSNSHSCLYCGNSYRKQDFSVCPHCGGDGGGVTPKTWRLTKRQKKEYVKKFNAN